MIKEFTYADLYPVYKAEKSFVGIYMWLHEYCHKYLEEHPEFEQVTLRMIGEDVGKLEGKVYEFKRETKPDSSNLRVNRD